MNAITMKLRKMQVMLNNPRMLWVFFANRGFFDQMDDGLYLRKRFKCLMGKELRLDKPITFNEKLQWLKIYDRKPVYNTMVDKYEAKLYVANIIGEEYIIPTLGVWNSFDEIEIDELPDRFVLKNTNDSGGIFFVNDKNDFNKDLARKILQKGFKRNFYYIGREWPYKDVKSRIIAEEYMSIWDDKKEVFAGQTGINGIVDYKFYCFKGEPLFLYVSQGLDNHDTARISFVSLKWERLPFYRTDYKEFDKIPPKPDHFEEMLCISRKLSKGTLFLRVDLYEINNRVFFSELTFFPCSGYMPFNDEKYDVAIGDLLKLDIETMNMENI